MSVDSEEKLENGNCAGWIVLIFLILIFSFNGDKREEKRKYVGIDEETKKENTLDRDEAILDYWYEIKDYVNGTVMVNACSSGSGGCYDLDADISGGVIDELYFDNGGYLYFSADIEDDGSASDYDQNGNNWDFYINMDSSIVNNAIDDWASDNDYTVY
ncbi:MAG: hypothetical protein WC671_01895 [Candidatus Paceibacterota bacterium]|jgi:hypothetical protein